MKELSATGRRFHGRRNPLQAQALQHGTFSNWSQKAAGGKIDQAIGKRRLVIVWTADWKITVGQAACAHERALLRLAPCAVEPDAFVAAKGTQAEFATDRQMSDLVARKHDACELDPETSGDGPRSFEVGPEGRDVAPLFQAIEMRDGMGADVLGWMVENPLDERQAEVIGVVLLICPDLVEVMIGGNSRIGVAGLARRKCCAHRRVCRKKQKPDGRPGTGNVPFRKEIAQTGNDLADAKDIRAVVRNGAVIAHAP